MYKKRKNGKRFSVPKKLKKHDVYALIKPPATPSGMNISQTQASFSSRQK